MLASKSFSVMPDSLPKWLLCRNFDHTGKEPGANTLDRDERVPVGPLDV